ncbi:AfsR/SARP family transcriptional regulator [Amycolatopsis nigrescens]|uniref:AfsR/SARP family transcriptional regulator n=1 Tax=Amycolatopsis nigrescens TaxID=381445 RepID=UPI0003A5E02C|nr:BTAD domain-containing putative transcriptional regulator [Amycolatopsis nigrescens]
MGELRVRLLGSFQLTLDARPVERPVRRKAQELLALVLLAPQRNVLREVAAEALWPAAGAEVSKKSMRQVLWQLHQATGPTGPRLVLTEGEVIRINPDRPVWLDVDAFVAASRTAIELVELTKATDLYRGPLMAGCYDDWFLIERARLEDLHITLLDKLSVGHERHGELEAAIHWAQRLLEVEPAHERTHRRLMHLYYRTDDRTRALRQYRRCQQVLLHELGIRPSARTVRLAAEIGADTGRPPEPAALDGVRAELAELRATVDDLRERLGEAETAGRRSGDRPRVSMTAL